MKITIKILSIALILCFANSLFAQKITSQIRESIVVDTLKFRIGAWGGMDLQLHDAKFKQLGSYENCCDEFSNPEGMGIALGALAEFPISSFILDLRLGYFDHSVLFTKNNKIANTKLVDANGVVTPEFMTSSHTLDANISAFVLEPSLKYNFIDNFNVLAGLKIGLLSNSLFSQQEELVSPTNKLFAETNSKFRGIYSEREIPNAVKFQMFATLGLDYDYHIIPKWHLQPEIRYNYAFNNVADVDWSMNNLQLGLALKYDIVNSRPMSNIIDTVYIRDTVTVPTRGIAITSIEKTDVSTQITREEKGNITYETHRIKEEYTKKVPFDLAPLVATLKAVGIDKNGKRTDNPLIQIEETEVEDSYPLLPFVFFKEGSADLNKTAMLLLDVNETASFDENKLERDVMLIYNDMLNIIASRMIKNPKADITITGCNNAMSDGKDNLTLSENRAIALRDYLVNVWKIDAKRVKIKKRNLPQNPGNSNYADGIQENQRAEISSDFSDIIKPLYIRDIERSSNPPLVEISGTVSGGQGEKSWELKVAQKNQEIRTYNGTGEDFKVNWEIEKGMIPTLEEMTNINLIGKDAENQIAIANKDLSIKQLTIRKKRFEMKDDKRIERFALILFEYDKAELTSIQKTILTDVKSKIKANSKVKISGFTDRTGDAEYNLNLANRRTQEVSKILNVSNENISLVPIGSKTLLYDNDSPQGRSYCRTVQIVIETPVKE